MWFPMSTRLAGEHTKISSVNVRLGVALVPPRMRIPATSRKADALNTVGPVNWKDVLLGPVSRQTWLATAHLLIGVPIALAASGGVLLGAMTGSVLAITLVGIPLGF